jgi:threonylcarbamoyladenosine tRNA methylthiotransferase CDKAL1
MQEAERKKVYIETFGCWLNKGEANIIATLLRKKGYEIVTETEKADIIIVNTCAVRGDTENKIFRRLQEVRKISEEKSSKIIVSGCLVNVRPKSILDIVPQASLVEPDAVEKIPEVIERGGPVYILRQYLNLRTILPDFAGRSFHIVPIQSGCLGNCAFCIEWVTRGKGVKSYDPHAIIENVRDAVKRGAREILLTGQDVATYGYDLKITLYDLLKDLLNEVSGTYRIRLGMMEPMLLNRFLKNLLMLFKDERLYRYFHIPVQSGDDKILRLMRRKYTVQEFKEMVSCIRGQPWRSSIVTDLIVGFPGEDDESFKRTLAFLEEVRFDKVHVARYTLRPFTEGYLMHGVPEPEKKRRSKLATEVTLRVAYEINKTYVGEVKESLIETLSFRGDLMARTIEYKPVIIKNQTAKIGELVKVKITDASPLHLFGEIID